MTEQYEQKNNEGVMFKNKDKQQDSHADYNGNIRVNGTDYWLNCWINESKKGTKYMKVSVKEKQAVHNEGVSQTQKALAPDHSNSFDDSLPPF